jgi:para-aminobenzoate synthetase component 1
MIVDLIRNDLGRICVPGSVAVDSLFKLQTLPSVHHLVSTVSGKLLPQKSGFGDIISALWPGGSVTGAPKVKAMEIIAEMETTARGPYCGSLAALGLDGGIKASLLIRTLFLKNGSAIYRAGGGIVADSVPEEEFEETELKAAMLKNLY